MQRRRDERTGRKHNDSVCESRVAVAWKRAQLLHAPNSVVIASAQSKWRPINGKFGSVSLQWVHVLPAKIKTWLHVYAHTVIQHVTTQHNRLLALCPRQPAWAGIRTRRNIKPIDTKFIVLEFLASIPNPPFQSSTKKNRKLNETWRTWGQQSTILLRSPNSRFDEARGKPLALSVWPLALQGLQQPHRRHQE